MWVFDLVSPVASAHRDDGELGQDDSTTDGGGHLFGALDTETNVTAVVSNSHKRLEPGSLTGTGLLLYGHDLQDIILQH